MNKRKYVLEWGVWRGMTPKVSVVMPAYNSERYIREAVGSVIRQTFASWELIIIDDCSSDGTWEAMEELARLDGRISIFQNSGNSGAGMTRNYGVGYAQAGWVAFLDSDDIWEAEKLEKQVRMAEGHPEARLLYTGSAFMTEAGERMPYVLSVPERLERGELLKQNLISCSSVLASRDCLLRNPMPGRRDVHEDFAAWLRILESEKCAYGINEPLLVYRKSGQSRSGNKARAARMSWNTYGEAGLGLFGRCYYMCWYMAKSMEKYRNL